MMFRDKSLILAWVIGILELFPQVPLRQFSQSVARHQSSRFWSYRRESTASWYSCSYNMCQLIQINLSAISNAQCWSLQSGTLVPQNWSLIEDWLLALKFANGTCTDSFCYCKEGNCVYILGIASYDLLYSNL